jgi:hypothetical protein
VACVTRVHCSATLLASVVPASIGTGTGTSVISDESHVTQVNDESVTESRVRRAAPGTLAHNESDNDLFTSAPRARA